jgi:lauroyl/myristoyl acyltransferase
MVAVGLGAAFREMTSLPTTASAPEKRHPGPLTRGLQAVGQVFFQWLYRKLGTRPPQQAEKLARVTVALMSLALARRQRANFSKLFPRLNAREIRALRARHARYLARLRVQVARLAHQPLNVLRDEVTWRGEEHLRAALAAGRGALVVGAHCGTWWHAPMCFIQGGLRVSSVVNPDMAPPLVEYMRQLAARFGLTMWFVNQDAYGAARAAFQRNEVFFIAMDRSLRPERSLWLPLGGARLAVDPGLAILALRQRPAVLWATCFHDDSGRSTVELSPEIAIGRGTPLATPEALSRDWVARLEKELAQRPEQWWTASFCSLTDTAPLPSMPPRKRNELN